MFSTGFVDGSFTLCTAFPRQDLMPSEQSVGNYGFITVEIRDDSPELLTTFGYVPITSVFFCGKRTLRYINGCAVV